MGAPRYKTGDKIGRLTVVSYAAWVPISKNSKQCMHTYNCMCECRTEVIFSQNYLNRTSVTHQCKKCSRIKQGYHGTHAVVNRKPDPSAKKILELSSVISMRWLP